MSLAATNITMTSRGWLPDPFEDTASYALPRTIADALRWAERITTRDGILNRAISKVAAYFITDIAVKPQRVQNPEAVGREEKTKFINYLTDRMKLRRQARNAAIDILTYGNYFCSVVVPFRRYLICRGKNENGQACGHSAPLSSIHDDKRYAYKWIMPSFHATCPHCGYTGEWGRNDRKLSSKPLIIKRWNPHEMSVTESSIQGNKDYVWRIPEYIRAAIRRGDLRELEDMPWEMVEAIHKNGHFKFSQGYVFHMLTPAPAGIDMAGMGLPPVVATFSQAWHAQILRRANETTAEDFILPTRLLSPAVRSGADIAGSDVMMNQVNGSGGFVPFVRGLVRQRQRSPKDWLVSPYPINYQTLGGDAKSFAPFEMITAAEDNLLASMGVPAQFYRGDLTMQAAPAALRLFEADWIPLVDQLNELLAFVVDRVSAELSWSPIDARFTKVTIADDINRQMAILQLMQTRQVSVTAGLKMLGMDFYEEQDNIIDEELYVSERQQQAQRDAADTAAQQQMGQGQPQAAAQPAQGGQPQAGGSQPDPSQMTPQDLVDYADQIAQSIQSMPSPTQQRSELAALRQSDPTGTLAAVVKDRMAKIRNDAKRSGGEQVMAQQFGQQGQQAQAQPQVKAAFMLPVYTDPAQKPWLKMRSKLMTQVA